MTTIARVLPLLACVLAFEACATLESETPPVESKVEDQFVSQALDSAEKAKKDYRISPGDLLSVSVFQEQDFTKETRVNQSGKISLPLVGRVALSGLTTLQAESKLKRLLEGYLVNPQVSVAVKEFRNRKFFILGEVERPGSYDIPQDRALTVVQAIALAGGFTSVAAPDRTRVVRKAGGKATTTIVPVNKVNKGDRSKDVSLEPDDTVVVPESFF